MSNDFVVDNLRCEYMKDPVGIDVGSPRLFWIIASSRMGARQTAYQIRVNTWLDDGSTGELLWDSGKVVTSQSTQIEYRGEALRSRVKVTWQVRAWDENDQPSDWSSAAFWEMGFFLKSEWKAKWIGANLVGGAHTTIPSPYLRKSFAIDPPVNPGRAQKDITRARLYVTALGLYEVSLNGQRVGNDVLSPGWTDYKKRVRYRVHDVKHLLKKGENVIGAILGDGWYCGNVSWLGRQNYGDRPKFLAQLIIQYSDQSTQQILTGEDWKMAFGPILESDLLMGESYDARLEFSGWDQPGFDTGKWDPVMVFPDPGVELVSTNGPVIKRIQELKPVSSPVKITQSPLSKWIFDMGQNMVGWIRFKCNGPAGNTITFRYSEVLKPDGNLYTENLRAAKQTDHYTLRGGDEEIYEPRFTFHGFRYVEMTGYPGVPDQETVTGIVLHTEMTPTGTFECSDPLINQLQHNIAWGQKGNYLDVPTDCPQRDERLGWTGDAQVFIRTAAFNFDVAAFFTKWQQDLADAQDTSGAIPPFAPFPDKGRIGDGGPAWADAVIICPWTVYLCYGDKRLLEAHYPEMQHFIDFLVQSSQNFIRPGKEIAPKEGYEWIWEGFGDWLAQDGSGKTPGGTPKDLIGTAFLAYSAGLMSKIAHVLGKEHDRKNYEILVEDVRKAFLQRFVTQDGLLIGQTQTACVLALHFGLLPEPIRPKVIAALLRDIVSRKMHLSTGFVGTPYLPHVLTAEGLLDTAYALLMQKTWPSWLYPVTQGATTIWERWDGWTQEKGFQDAGMNSFNHYAYGCIGDWMYAVITGIEVDMEQPGYKHFILHPRPGGGLSHARAVYHSIHGKIESSWRMELGKFSWDVVVPANTSARIAIPLEEGRLILESSKPIDQAESISFVNREPQAGVYEIESGQYHFEVMPEKNFLDHKKKEEQYDLPTR